MMKKILFMVVSFFSIGLISCNFSATTKEVNADSLRADSLWRIAIADSINNVRNSNGNHPTETVTDTSPSDIESITRGIQDGLNKVQDGLNKVKKVTEVSANSTKAITDGINKTRNAVNKTIDEAKRTINGEPKPQQ